jgi:hypothetical protein
MRFDGRTVTSLTESVKIKCVLSESFSTLKGPSLGWAREALEGSLHSFRC